MIFLIHSVLSLNTHMRRNHFWGARSELSTLPALSSQSPLPFSGAVPSVMRPHFIDMAHQSEVHFKHNAELETRAASINSKLRSILKKDDIAIGVLYRGGDKLSIECSSTERISWFVHFPPLVVAFLLSLTIQFSAVTSPSTPRQLINRISPCCMVELEREQREGGNR